MKAVCEAYAEHVLAPSLEPGQLVVLDNRFSYEGSRIRELMRVGAAS
jgi:hypothetical protein